MNYADHAIVRDETLDYTHYPLEADFPLDEYPAEDWRRVIRMSIQRPDEGKALIFISLLQDAREVFVRGDLRDPLDELGQVWHRRPLLRLLLQLALAHTPLSGLRRREPFDVKHQGLLPIVDIARYASFAGGVRMTSTRERLDFASTAGVIGGHDARVLAESHQLFWRLRLSHQVEQLREGLAPDDRIDPESLDQVTRGALREAFQAIRSVQRSLPVSGSRQCSTPLASAT